MVRLLLVALVMAIPLESHAQVRLSRLFTDRMVLQRDVHVPVWGWAGAGDQVVVTLDGADYSAVADGTGAWMVRLEPMAAGGPHTMSVRSGEIELQVRDIMAGDVWLASGQSNMEWVVADAAGTPTADPGMRHFKVPRSWAYDEVDSLAGGEWERAAMENVGTFTAVGYYFARELRQHIGVPIGIINSSWGGSRIEPWMSLDALGMDRADFARIRADEQARQEAIRERVRARLGRVPDKDAGLVDGVARWAAPALDDSEWFTVPVPSNWEAAGFDGMDGVAWYRTRFELTADDVERGVQLGLGMIDDSDITWVNGVEVGSMDNAWNQARLYEVPSDVLEVGENVISVRVEDFQGGGGIAGPTETVFLDVGGARRQLPHEWRFMVGRVSLNSDGNKNQVATLLWNKMIHPILRFPIKGVIWYQGESNADRMEDALAYDELFQDMIHSWRDAWQQDDLPFFWAQLASFMAVDDDPNAESNWAVLREAQSAALALPNTGQAILIDIGEADDIHPRNKQDVGHRLALAARKVAYGEDVVYSGPTYRDCEFSAGQANISFNHRGGGLVARGEELRGFAVAGPDRHFVWAQARIDGDRVVVWSDAVPNPVAVRYAWANNPEAANLYNAEGLPAAPFRTDRW
jgi:sialate O-acetylesterase